MEPITPPNTTSTPLVLFLHQGQVQVLIDALVAFANQCEAEGDICGVAPTCDEVAKRLRALRSLDEDFGWAREMMKEIGLGRYKNRPQG